VVGHQFFNQFEKDADLEKLKIPVVTHDAAETVRRLEMAHRLFDGILGVVEQGYDPSYLTVWVGAALGKCIIPAFRKYTTL
jgi:hypothetical protein